MNIHHHFMIFLNSLKSFKFSSIHNNCIQFNCCVQDDIKKSDILMCSISYRLSVLKRQLITSKFSKDLYPLIEKWSFPFASALVN